MRRNPEPPAPSVPSPQPRATPKPMPSPAIQDLWDDCWTPKQSNWQPSRPYTPTTPKPSTPLPKATKMTPTPSRPPASPPAFEIDSSDSEAERDLRRLTGVPLMKRRLGDSPGWKGASADPKWSTSTGVTTRSAARQMEQTETTETADQATGEPPETGTHPGTDG